MAAGRRPREYPLGPVAVPPGGEVAVSPALQQVAAPGSGVEGYPETRVMMGWRGVDRTLREALFVVDDECLTWFRVLGAVVGVQQLLYVSEAGVPAEAFAREAPRACRPFRVDAGLDVTLKVRNVSDRSRTFRGWLAGLED